MEIGSKNPGTRTIISCGEASRKSRGSKWKKKSPKREGGREKMWFNSGGRKGCAGDPKSSQVENRTQKEILRKLGRLYANRGGGNRKAYHEKGTRKKWLKAHT